MTVTAEVDPAEFSGGHFMQSTLADLTQLALEKSSQKRVELLHRITDAYVATSDDHSSAEQYLLNDIVEKLLSKNQRPGQGQRRRKPGADAQPSRRRGAPACAG